MPHTATPFLRGTLRPVTAYVWINCLKGARFIPYCDLTNNVELRKS